MSSPPTADLTCGSDLRLSDLLACQTLRSTLFRPSLPDLRTVRGA